MALRARRRACPLRGRQWTRGAVERRASCWRLPGWVAGAARRDAMVELPGAEGCARLGRRHRRWLLLALAGGVALGDATEVAGALARRRVGRWHCQGGRGGWSQWKVGGWWGPWPGAVAFRILVRVDAKIVAGRGQGGVLGRDPWGPAERARGGVDAGARARYAGEVVRVSAARPKRGLVAGGAGGEDGFHADGTLPVGLLGRRGAKGGSGCHA